MSRPFATTLHDETSAAIVACQDCGWEGAEASLDPIDDLHLRVSPGEIVPTGQCPSCGALAHPKETKNAR